MSCNWPLVTLSEVTSRIGDGLHGTPKYDDNGDYYFINGNNLSNGKIIINEKTKRTDESQYLKHKKDLNDRTLLVSINGTLGNIGTYQGEKVFLGKSACYLNVLPNVNKDYVMYVLTSKHFQDYIHNLATGSTIKNVGLKLIREYEFQLPDIKTQNSIANVLVSIDSKITVNQQTNQTLEQMAQAIFKSWFVDFDPVKAKMNGEQPEGMDAATASLFPDKLVESELGLIPEGWSVEEAKSQLDVLRGFSYKGKGLVGSLDEGVPMHNLNSVLEGGGYKYAGLKFYSEEFKEKFAIQEGDVLVANTEQGHNHLLIGYGAMVPKHLAHGFFSHHTYRVRPKKNSNMTPEFIERLFGKGRFARQVQGFTNGTTVNMLPTAGMEMPQFVVPPKALAQKFSELVKPMKAMIEENHKSNIELAKLRDTLLPKLLSGEIELDVAEVNTND